MNLAPLECASATCVGEFKPDVFVPAGDSTIREVFEGLSGWIENEAMLHAVVLTGDPNDPDTRVIAFLDPSFVEDLHAGLLNQMAQVPRRPRQCTWV